jgi:hypothetical protein
VRGFDDLLRAESLVRQLIRLGRRWSARHMALEAAARLVGVASPFAFCIVMAFRPGTPGSLLAWLLVP